MARMMNASVAAAFLQWKTTVTALKGMRLLVHRMLNNQISKSFESWFDFVETRHRNRVVIDRVRRRLQNRDLGAAWRAWESWASTHRKQRQVVGRILQRMLGNQLSKYFQTWCSQMEDIQRQGQVVDKIARRWRNMCIASVFDTWCDFVVSRRRNRVLFANIGRRMYNMALASAWDTWAEAVYMSRADVEETQRCEETEKAADEMAVLGMQCEEKGLEIEALTQALQSAREIIEAAEHKNNETMASVQHILQVRQEPAPAAASAGNS